MKTKGLPALIGVLLAAAVWTGYRMSELPLWGHLPLLLFAGLWMALVLLWHWRRHGSDPSHIRWLALSTIAGTLLAMGFPPLPTTFTMLAGFVPLFFLEREARAAGGRKSMRTYAWYMYHALVLWNILATYWVANTALIAGVVAIMANALLMLIPWLLFSVLRRRLGGIPAYIAFVAFWLAFEHGHMRWEVTWPWLTLGNSLSQYTWACQWYEYTGTGGGSLWILLANVMLFRLLWLRQETGAWQRPLAAGLAIWIVLPLLVSVWIYRSYTPQGRTTEMVVVQPNYEPHYQKFAVPGPQQAERYAALAAQVLTPETRFLVFPETAFEGIDLDALDDYREMSIVRDLTQDYPGLCLVTGLSAYRVFPRYMPERTHLRQTRRGDRTIYWEAYNAAISTDPEGRLLDIYLKSKLVPGPEIFPYKEALFFLRPLIESLDGTIDGLGIQEDRGVFAWKGDTVAPVICYESIFGEYVTGYIRNGAQAILIMTNDGWWDLTPGHIQHLRFGALRAIETRRDIARSANTGISGFIDQRGDLHQATRYDEPVALRGEVRMNTGHTFYVRWGDYIGRAAVALSALLIGWMLLTPLIKRRR